MKKHIVKTFLPKPLNIRQVKYYCNDIEVQSLAAIINASLRNNFGAQNVGICLITDFYRGVQHYHISGFTNNSGVDSWNDAGSRVSREEFIQIATSVILV